jgi:hypothetical protein
MGEVLNLKTTKEASMTSPAYTEGITFEESWWNRNAHLITRPRAYEFGCQQEAARRAAEREKIKLRAIKQ